MLKVGLTGGIGSGKTFVANIFAHLGIPVYNADTEAKNLYNTDMLLLQQLRNKFSDNIFNGDILNKKALAAIVFSDSNALAALNSFVHPVLEKHFSKWVAIQTLPYIIQEAAILFESGFGRLMDKTIVIAAPQKLRIKRVMKRDKVSEEEVRKRMQHQLNQSELINMADFIITADDTAPLLPQVLNIHNQLLKLSEDGLC